MLAYYGTAISEHITKKPNGGIVCTGVPVARTGVQEYLAQELQLDGDPERLVQVTREPEARRQKDEVIQKLLREEIRFLHVCEHCGKQEWLAPQEVFDAGWDYPPKMGWFGIVSPKTCGNCTIKDTLWWAVTMENIPSECLSRTQEETMERILGEPWNLLDESDRSSILWEISDDEGKDPPC